MERKRNLIYIQKNETRLKIGSQIFACHLYFYVPTKLKLSGFEVYFSKLYFELRSELWASASCCLSQRRLNGGLSNI